MISILLVKRFRQVWCRRERRERAFTYVDNSPFIPSRLGT